MPLEKGRFAEDPQRVSSGLRLRRYPRTDAECEMGPQAERTEDVNVDESGMRWFPSKVDAWLIALLVFVPLPSLLVLVGSIRTGDATGIRSSAMACALVAAIYVGLVFPVRYGVGHGVMVLRFGLARSHVDLTTITLVEPTRSVLASPALSLDRLALRASADGLPSAIVSPADKQAFLDAVAAEAGLERVGDTLVRPEETLGP